MFVWWDLGLIGLFLSLVYCQDDNPLSIDNEPEVNVILTVDTQPKSSIDLTVNEQQSELLVCPECVNCHIKSDSTTRVCESDINMCYTIYKRINNTTQAIRRGCSTSKGQCTVPNDDDQSNVFDSVTCCTVHTCNQGIQFKPLFFLLILNLFIIMINI